jgi:hypothetical protein
MPTTRSCIGAVVPLLALLAACQNETALSPTSGDPTLKVAPTTANSNGPVWVQGSFTLTLTIAEGNAGVNKHPQQKGTCKDADGNINQDPTQNTFWYAPGNPEQVTAAKFCQDTSGGPVQETIQCTVDATGLPGTYAFGTGGQGFPVGNQLTNNENMNFHSDLIPQQLDQFVHYGASTKKGQKGNTTGKDETAFTFSCEDGTVGDAYIDLSGFNAVGVNLFGHGTRPSGTLDRWLDVANGGNGIDVNMYATGDGPYTQGEQVGTGTLTSLYWLYRSRVAS